ncbi:MAG: glycosyltransferase family 39 protein [Microcoleaceae cyanobacterium]
MKLVLVDINTTTHRHKFDWQQWLPIALILLLATGLDIYNLDTESLWKDELLSVDRATKNFDILRPRTLSYILLRGWIMLGGNSDSWLRGLCVVFTLGSVFLTYRLGCRLASKPVGLISALFIALSPLFINHAQEVRMYGISTFFGLLGTLILTSALESPNKLSIGGWAIARWLAIISTPLNLLLLLPDTVLFAWRFHKQKRVLFSFGVGLIAVCLLWSPWLINVALSSLDFMGGVRGVGTVDPNLIVIKKPSPSIINVLLQPGRFTAWSFGKPISTPIFWFYNLYSVMVASLIGLGIFDRRNSDKLGWAAAWGFLPLIPIFLVSQISRSLWVDRYIIFTAPYLFILLAAGFIGVWHRWRIPAVAIAAIYFVAIAGGLKRYYSVSDREDWRGLVQLIQTKEQSGDIIVWSASELIPRALNHYYGGVATIEVRQDQPQDDPQAVESWLQSLPKTQSRILLVYANRSPTLLSGIEKEFNVEQLYKINARGTVELFLLAPRTSQDTQLK